MDGSRRLSHFAKLKEKVLKEVSPSNHNCSMERIKDFFKENINSNRAMSKVKSLQNIFQLLEDRYLLSERNVTPLSCLGNFLNIPKINELVGCYVDLHWKNNDEYCKCICGKTCDFQIYLNQPNQNNSSDLNNNDDDELGEAIINIASRIGKLWPDLIRQLEVKERHINEIREKFSLENQPKEALLFWRRSAGSKATIEALDAALEERLNRRKGLGLHLKEPVYSV